MQKIIKTDDGLLAAPQKVDQLPNRPVAKQTRYGEKGRVVEFHYVPASRRAAPVKR